MKFFCRNITSLKLLQKNGVSGEDFRGKTRLLEFIFKSQSNLWSSNLPKSQALIAQFIQKRNIQKRWLF